MAELVDALDSKSSDSNIVRVRVSLWAQIKAIARITPAIAFFKSSIAAFIL